MKWRNILMVVSLLSPVLAAAQSSSSMDHLRFEDFKQFASRPPTQAHLRFRESTGLPDALVATTGERVIEFHYLADGRLGRITSKRATREFGYADPSPKPTTIFATDEVGASRLAANDRALLADVIEEFNQTRGGSLLAAIKRREDILEKTMPTAIRNLVKPKLLCQDNSDAECNLPPPIAPRGTLFCEIPVLCAACLGACEFVARQRREECIALYDEQQRLNCLVNAGRDEIICGLFCL